MKYEDVIDPVYIRSLASARDRQLGNIKACKWKVDVGLANLSAQLAVLCQLAIAAELAHGELAPRITDVPFPTMPQEPQP